MKKILFGAVLAIFGVLAMMVAPTLAVNSQLCADLSGDPEAAAAAGCGTQKSAGAVATSVIQVVLGFIGVLTVCMIIYGGFLFLSSSGDAGKVKRGQDAIKYGLIGLVVAILASTIVLFVSKSIGH